MKQTLLILLALLYVVLEFVSPLWPPEEPIPYGVDREGLLALRHSFSADTVQSFLETAFRAEDLESARRIHKWAVPIRLQIHGSPTSGDRFALERAVSQITPLIRPHRIELTNKKPNVDVYFLPSSQLRAHEPKYRPGLRGLYWCWWSSSGTIYRARFVIATDATTEPERRRLIRLYLVRILGFRGATDSNKASVMSSDRSVDAQDYSALDRALIELLYRPEIPAGMSERVAQIYLSEP